MRTYKLNVSHIWPSQPSPKGCMHRTRTLTYVLGYIPPYTVVIIYYCFYIALLMNCIAWEGINKLYHFVSHPRYLKSCIVYRWCGLTYAGGVLSWPFSIHLAGPESTTLKHEPSVADKHSSRSQSSSSQSDETIFWRIQSATVHN